MVRYNGILSIIHSTAKEMLLAIDGFVVMSGEMEICYNNIFNNQVSFQWKNPDFLLKNPYILLKNPDFLLNDVDIVIKQVPSMWECVNFLSIMPLVSWFVDLIRRMNFIQAWYSTLKYNITILFSNFY